MYSIECLPKYLLFVPECANFSFRINQVTAKGKGSVPRGRVYANYASRCATERITVLNPASFGKLVRVLFPGLQTRRLGVRGESKYHYVNFTLMEDQPELKEPAIQPALPIQGVPQFGQSFRCVHCFSFIFGDIADQFTAQQPSHNRWP